MNTGKFTFLIVLALLFVGCGKDYDEVNLDYTGSWEGSDAMAYYSLIIQPSRSYYRKVQGSTVINAEGECRIKQNESKLNIGIKGFVIDQIPTTDANGRAEMILDGVTYNKY
jgi:hypothetical protein